MKDKIILIAGLAFIAGCAVFVFIRIESSYSPPDAPPPVPAVWSQSPAGLPVSTAAPASTAPATASSTARPSPRHTVTTWVTVTTTVPPPPPPASAAGEDGP